MLHRSSGCTTRMGAVHSNTKGLHLWRSCSKNASHLHRLHAPPQLPIGEAWVHVRRGSKRVLRSRRGSQARMVTQSSCKAASRDVPARRAASPQHTCIPLSWQGSCRQQLTAPRRSSAATVEAWQPMMAVCSGCISSLLRAPTSAPARGRDQHPASQSQQQHALRIDAGGCIMPLKPASPGAEGWSETACAPKSKQALPPCAPAATSASARRVQPRAAARCSRVQRLRASPSGSGVLSPARQGRGGRGRAWEGAESRGTVVGHPASLQAAPHATPAIHRGSPHAQGQPQLPGACAPQDRSTPASSSRLAVASSRQLATAKCSTARVGGREAGRVWCAGGGQSSQHSVQGRPADIAAWRADMGHGKRRGWRGAPRTRELPVWHARADVGPRVFQHAEHGALGGLAALAGGRLQEALLRLERGAGRGAVVGSQTSVLLVGSCSLKALPAPPSQSLPGAHDAHVDAVGRHSTHGGPGVDERPHGIQARQVRTCVQHAG